MMATSPGPTNDDEPVSPLVITKQTFFRVGEIRLPTDEDFEYFLSLSEVHEGWTKKYDRNGLTVWLREIPGKDVKMLKIMTTFFNIDPEVMYDVLHDGDYRRIWDENVVKDCNICHLEGTDSDIGYYAMKCPAPLRNRDFVNQRCWRAGTDEFIIFNHSVAHRDFPPTKQFIRGLSHVTGYVVKRVDGGSHVSYVTHSDPRGRVPAWILNLAVSKVAPRIIAKFRKAAEMYPEWKRVNNPDHKPWLNPSQIDIPVVNVNSLLQFDLDDIPLSPVKGQPDYLGEEAELEDESDMPDCLLPELVFETNVIENGHS